MQWDPCYAIEGLVCWLVSEAQFRVLYWCIKPNEVVAQL